MACSFSILKSKTILPNDESSSRSILLPSIISATIGCVSFWFDSVTPLGIAAGITYLLLVFCSLWFPRAKVAFLFAAIGSALTIIAFFIKPPSPLEAEII